MRPADFEWQTDDEEMGVVLPNMADPKTHRQWPWRLLMSGLLLATAVFLGLRWRTARQTEAIMADVKIAHALMQEAAAAQDVEMLNLVLSGRDLDWQEAQQTLMANGHFTNHPAFSLQAVPAPNAVPEITLSPDLREAVAVGPQTFQTDAGEGVILQQTAVYRQGSRNWLLAPPTEAFWGPTLITNTQYFHITYPQRDAMTLQQITADLNILFAEQVCNRILLCEHDFAFNLTFSTDPHSLVTVNNPLSWLQMGDGASLPTPTLVGLPLDEAGYEILLKGYAAQVVTAVIVHRFAYDCCDHALLAHALLAKQVSKLSLQTWPLTHARYQHLLNFTFGQMTAEEMMAETELSRPENRELAYALVDFLIAETSWNPTQLAAALFGNGGASLYLPQLVSEKDFDYRWLAFVSMQAENGRPPATALPPSIQASCPSLDGQSLYTYHPSTGNWSDQSSERPPFTEQTLLWPLPQGDGYLLNQQIATRFRTETRLTLHYQQQDVMLRQYVLLELAPLPQFELSDLSDPNGRYLAFYESGRTRFDSYYFIVDLDSCTEDNCQMKRVLGQPQWSPDGVQIVLAERPLASRDDGPYEPFYLPLSRGDGAGKSVTAVGLGFAPVWMDNDQYSYLRMNNERVPEFVVAAIENDVPQVVLTAADLRAVVPANVPPGQLFMVDTIVAAPDQVAIIAATNLLTDSLEYVFLWENASELQLMQVGDIEHVGFSPDGRWLTFSNPQGQITLTEIQTGQQQSLHSPTNMPDWTADSQWLLTSRANYLLLTAPYNGYQQIIFNPTPNCQHIRWIE